jgi:hypothetical protein
MKKALLVGINHYDSNLPNLNSCVKLTKDIEKLLSRNVVDSEPNFDCRVLTSSDQNDSQQITRALLKENCKALFEDDEADIALFYFSGYGSEDQMGGYLVAQNTEDGADGFSIDDLMIYANNSSIKEIYLILDCHVSDNAGNHTHSNSEFSLLRKGISVLSVKNTKKGKSSLFPELLVTALKGGNTDILGNITFIDLYEQTVNILSEFGYEITFRTNVSRMSILRKVPSKIPRNVLLKMRSYFHEPHYYVPLSKRHIPSLKLGDKEKIADFKNLQKMFKQGLVKPINAFHFYYAAFNEKHCGLTELGKQYWELIDKNRI